MLTFIRSHRHDDGFDTLECVVVDVHILYGFANTGNHGCKIFQITHFLNLVDLLEEVVESELVFA